MSGRLIEVVVRSGLTVPCKKKSIINGKRAEADLISLTKMELYVTVKQLLLQRGSSQML